MNIEIGLILLILFFLLVLMNIPIAVSLGLSTIITMILYGIPLGMYLDTINAGLSKYTLLAVPFFILAGFIMEKSGISKRIIAFARLDRFREVLELSPLWLPCFGEPYPVQVLLPWQPLEVYLYLP